MAENNYASYLLSVENTSGLIEEEDGTLYLPPNEEDWVPDETTFEDFDIAMEVPQTATVRLTPTHISIRNIIWIRTRELWRRIRLTPI